MGFLFGKNQLSGQVLAILASFMMVNCRQLNLQEDIITSRISRDIFLQKEMETKLKEKFQILFEEIILRSASSSETFMYVCDKNCIDKNLYGYGITSAFLLAALSNRKFSIYPDRDVPFYIFYEPAVYDWKENEAEIRSKIKTPMVKTSRKWRQFLAEVYKTETELCTMNFAEQFNKTVIYLSGNYDWILDLRRHRRTTMKMSWLFATHASDLIRLLHYGLFQLPDRVEEIINNELIQMVGENRLVCFHGNNNDYIVQVNSFLDFVSKGFGYDTVYYISGIDKFHSFVFTHRPEISHKIISLNKINILNKLMENGRHISERGLDKLLDIHVLRLCDTLVSTESQTGIMAARLRRREDNLYCFRDGVIFPCTRRLIAGSFRDKDNIPEYIDINYYCEHSDAECVPASQVKI